MEVRIYRYYVRKAEKFKVEINFDDSSEWHLGELIARLRNDIFPEENIKAFFDECNDECEHIFSFSAKSYYWMLRTLWGEKICKFDPNEYDNYFGQLVI